MIFRKPPKIAFCVVPLILTMIAAAASAQSMFLMGEDVVHPSGLILSVNSMQRRPFASGLGVSRQDEVFINMTFVNTGVSTCRIDPLKDFVLELDNRFEPTLDQEAKATRDAFNIFPSAQSRIDLYFKVDSSQTVMPILQFYFGDASVSILCDPELQRLLQKSNETTLRSDEAVKLGKVLVEGGRYTLAENVLRRAVAADPVNNQLLMLMASVEDASNNRENAEHYLRMVNPATISDRGEAVAIAKLAVNLGFYDLAVSVLSPFEMVGRLEPEERILLARASYYENDLNSAERILEAMVREGSKDGMVYFTYANLFDRRGDIERAIEYWEKAIELAPNYAEAHFNMGVGYYKLQQIDKARSCWQKVLLLRPYPETLRAAEDALRSIDY